MRPTSLPPPRPPWNENIQYTKYSMRWNIFELKIEKFKKSRASSQNFTFLYKKYMTEFIPMINKYIQYYNLSTAILKTNTNKFTRNSNYFLTPWEKLYFHIHFNVRLYIESLGFNVLLSFIPLILYFTLISNHNECF